VEVEYGILKWYAGENAVEKKVSFFESIIFNNNY